jgi:CubicO group peptidase (beta-lactamase class C family)
METMPNRQFRILYREFLFRVIDLELLTPQGDIVRLLGQFAALLVSISLVLTLTVGLVGAASEPELSLLLSWVEELFLISISMLAVGLFAVLSWDTAFPDKRDVMVLAPLPVRAPTLFLAKVAAVATALGITLFILNFLPGLAGAFVFAAVPVTPPPTYQPAMPPVGIADMQSVLQRDLGSAFTVADGAFVPEHHGGAVVGLLQHGEKRVIAYGTAKPDSIFEIGSITKTFTGLVLARMVVEGKVTLNEPVRLLLPPGTVAQPPGREITLLNLITHHSGLPRTPTNLPATGTPYADYHAAELYVYMAGHGVALPAHPQFLYSNLGVGLLGQALANRAGTTYQKLIREEITGPLGMKDTAAAWAPEQAGRILQSYFVTHKPLPVVDLDALAGAGAIRSSAGDMLIYLQAQLHPESLNARLSVLTTALVQSHEFHADAPQESRIALAWMYNPTLGAYWHNGSVAGYNSDTFFDPKEDYAAVVLYNSASPVGFAPMLDEHIRERFAGLPAVSLANPVAPGRGGARGVARSFGAYWITMLSAGIFVYCSVLTVQGFAQMLPRQTFLRLSSMLQMGFFVLLLTVYFLQPAFAGFEDLIENQSTLSWIPTYWFFALFQKLNGPVLPQIAQLANRAWLGLSTAIAGTVAAYLICYFRTLKKIAEQPDILPSSRVHWLPRFGGRLETALTQFSLRTLLRSRQHRVLLSFYLGTAFGLAIFLSKAPLLHENTAASDVWYHVNAPLLVGSILMMIASVVGTRVVFTLPLELRANWIFRVLPLPDLRGCLGAIRRSLYTLGVVPVWAVTAMVFFRLWPWRAATEHMVVLAILGVLVAECTLIGFQKIPFTCSYLPGRSKFHMAGLAGLGQVLLMSQGAEWERDSFDHPFCTRGLPADCSSLRSWSGGTTHRRRSPKHSWCSLRVWRRRPFKDWG